MAGGRALAGVAAGAGSGAGVPGLLGLLVVMEAGVPIPVPSDLVMLPSDLVMLLLGERVSAGALPLWLAVVLLELVALAGTAALYLAARGPGRALIARFGPGRALAALVLGSSLFVQAHLLLGYLLGPAAREVLEQARLPVLVAAVVVVVTGRRPGPAPPRPGRPGPGRWRLPRLPGPRPGARQGRPGQAGTVPAGLWGPYREGSPTGTPGCAAVHRGPNRGPRPRTGSGGPRTGSGTPNRGAPGRTSGRALLSGGRR